VRRIVVLAVFLVALAQAGAAWAHASLVRAEPADGVLLAEPPAVLRLTFNEPVSPLVIRLIAPDGSVTTPAAAVENSTVTVTPSRLTQRGTHVLSWRVISADGHPVAGSLVFSVGEASARPRPGTLPAGDALVRAAFWGVKLVLHVGIFVGVGGAFFRVWMADGRPVWLDRLLIGLIVAGLLVAPLSVGLQGLDALGMRLAGLMQRTAWVAGLGTSYALTAIAAAFALVAALFSFWAPAAVARLLTPAALVLAGLAPALSGHASNAAPQALTRPAVFVHAACVAFWIGALLPLAAGVARGERSALARFTQVIPYALAALLAAGAVLTVMQLDRVDALWTTRYGVVLSCKLAAIAVLLALAAANRYGRARDRAGGRARPVARLIAIEAAVAVVILALVGLWHFTPPPRALAAAAPVAVHLHGTRAMAQLTLTPVRARDPVVSLEVLDGEFNALVVKEVTLVLANRAAKIEPLRRPAVAVGGVRWRVDGVRIPLAGRWTVRVDLLVDDFTKIVLEDEVDLPRLP